MAWDGFCIMCQRNVEFEEIPSDDALPDCPVCSSPVVALADENDKVLWVIDPVTTPATSGASQNGSSREVPS